MLQSRNILCKLSVAKKAGLHFRQTCFLKLFKSIILISASVVFYYASRALFNSSLEVRPTKRFTSAPSLNRISVGMLTTRNCCASAIFWSTSTFPTAYHSSASSSTTGPWRIHGPHQVAQKSIRTGFSDLNTSVSKFAVVLSFAMIYIYFANYL